MQNKRNLIFGLLNILWYLFVILFYYKQIWIFKSNFELVVFSSFINFGVGIVYIFIFLHERLLKK